LKPCYSRLIPLAAASTNPVFIDAKFPQDLYCPSCVDGPRLEPYFDSRSRRGAWIRHQHRRVRGHHDLADRSTPPSPHQFEEIPSGPPATGRISGCVKDEDARCFRDTLLEKRKNLRRGEWRGNPPSLPTGVKILANGKKVSAGRTSHWVSSASSLREAPIIPRPSPRARWNGNGPEPLRRPLRHSPASTAIAVAHVDLAGGRFRRDDGDRVDRNLLEAGFRRNGTQTNRRRGQYARRIEPDAPRDGPPSRLRSGLRLEGHGSSVPGQVCGRQASRP